MRADRTDPGDCLICGAAHCSCGGTAPIEVVQLPARDARAIEVKPGLFVSTTSTSIFSTATYRGKGRQR